MAKTRSLRAFHRRLHEQHCNVSLVWEQIRNLCRAFPEIDSSGDIDPICGPEIEIAPH